MYDAYRRPDGRFDLVVGGERLVVHRWDGGGGPLAVALHGLLSDHRELGALPARLAEAGFDVVAPDFRGCGDSGGPRALHTLPRMLEDVDAVAARLGRRARLLVGHSLGAAAAVHAVADGILAPERIALASPPDDFAAHGSVVLRGMARVAFGLAGAPAFRRLVLPLPSPYRRMVRAESARAWAAEQGFKSRRVRLATWHALRELGTAAAAREISGPALVLIAEDDRVVPPFLSERVAAALSSARVARFPGYHSVFLDEAGEAAARTVVEFAKEKP